MKHITPILILLVSFLATSCNNNELPTPIEAIKMKEPNKFPFTTSQMVPFKLNYGSAAHVQIFTVNPLVESKVGKIVPAIDATTNAQGVLNITAMLPDAASEFYAYCPTEGMPTLKRMVRTSHVTEEKGEKIEKYTYSDFEDIATASSRSGGEPAPTNLNHIVLTQSGVLGFEDCYPSVGDWDMNDVMVDYLRIITIENGNVKSIVDTWEFFCDGASTAYRNAFGYELFGEINAKDSTNCNIKRSDVNVTVENINTGTRIKTHGIDEDLTSPTVMLFDDVNLVDPAGSFRVTTTFNRTVPYSEISGLNHNLNPFIVIVTYGEADAYLNYNRTEVHPSYYRPTPKFNLSIFGKADDRSNYDKHIYFVRNQLTPYPFAIHCVGDSYYVKDDKGDEHIVVMPLMVLPGEGEAASKSFKNFNAWYQSNGIEHKDWYNREEEDVKM